MKSKVYFADEKIKKAFEELKNSRTEDQILHTWIMRAINDLAENAFCGIQLPKRIIPVPYIQKYKIDNLWKYDLPKGWRLLYTVAHGEIIVISIVIEWMNHKNYERKFNY